MSIVLSLRVDKLYERKVIWAEELGDRNSESYQQLSYEAERAVMIYFLNFIQSNCINFKGQYSSCQVFIFHYVKFSG